MMLCVQTQMMQTYFPDRLLSKDYEVLPESSEAMIHIAMTRIMLRRLAKN